MKTRLLSLILISAFSLQLSAFSAPKPRFSVTDRTWPQTPGDAEICLWPDDAHAAVSFTIDDNNAPDHPWWLEQAAAHDLRLTWFVITGRVGTGSANWGTWDDFKKLAAAGHEIASHTVFHFNKNEPGWAGVEWEYAESQRQIAEHIGQAAVTIAYPGMPDYKLNDFALAAKMYRAGRGFIGRLNAANAIDYFAVAATNTANMADVSNPAADIHKLFTRAPGIESRFYRGWMVFYSHDVRKPEHKQKIQNLLEYLKPRRADLYINTFSEVSKFAQERDTARLTVLEKTADKIVLQLTDQMDDTYFNHPLTIKIRLPETWRQVAATQSGKPVPVRLITHEEKPYALLDIIPDAGETTLAPQM